MRTTRLFFLTFLTTSAVLGGAGAADPAPAKADDKKSLFHLPNGITDAAGEVGYLTTPKGDGLVAVDLETGKALWETTEANQALVVDGTRLIARTGRENRLRVVVLDTTAKGKRLLESEPLDIPTWVAVARPWTYQGLARTFVVGGKMVGGTLELDWSAHAGYWGGKRPSPEQEKGRTASGRARVDLKTGKVEALPAAKVEGPAEQKKNPVLPLDVKSDRTDFKDFPAEVQAVAKKNAWSVGCLLGPRAYGVRGSDKHYILQAADVKTGKVLWERPIREWVYEQPAR